MPRNYDRLIRFYDSWFDDLTDPEKALSAEEIVGVLLAIREAQRQMSTAPLDALPLSVRRALSMSTLREQLTRIIERCESARARGSKGGTTTAAMTRAAIIQEANDKRAQDAAETRAAIPDGYTSLSWYTELKRRAANGDTEAAQMLQRR